jgi:hypothetical protein
MAQGYTASRQIWNDSFIYECITVDGKVDGNREVQVVTMDSRSR